MRILNDYEFEDTLLFQHWFAKRGYHLTQLQCATLWEDYSQEQCASWLMFSTDENRMSEIIENELIPLIPYHGENAVENVFKKSGVLLTSGQIKQIAEKHFKDNKFTGWRDEVNVEEIETFTEEAYKNYLLPIAKELNAVE